MKKIGLIALVLSFAVFFSGCFKPPSPEGEEQKLIETAPSTEDDQSFTGSMKDLLALGKSLKCEVSYQDENSQGKSVSYVSGNNARSETEMKVNGQEFKSHVIVNGEWVYIWDDVQKKGTKTKLDQEDVKNFSENTEESEGMARTDLNESFDFKCSPWIPDSNKFEPPSDVEFADLSQLLNNVKQDACAVCDIIPDETAKADCKKSCSQ